MPGDGAWRALAVAMADGRAIAALPRSADASPTAALVCRPGPAMPPGGPGPERDLGVDQSNTSVVLGDPGTADQILLKAYRRVQPGLNPDLEMTAFLTEEAGFTAVPPLAGFVELVESRHGTSTLAMGQAFVLDGADGYEAVAEALTAWLLAPGAVTLEFATEVAADVGALTAGLHVAVADGRGLPEMAPRPATRDELRSWSREAHANLERALDVAAVDDGAAATIRDLAPRIQEVLTVVDALPEAPEVIRAHGDLHLGQILIAPDGYRIIDFEGEPLSTPEERRAHRHPLRDVASMLRSLDHVGRSAGRRAEERNGGPLATPGLDLPGWLSRSRERFLEAYREGLREARVWVDDDPDSVARLRGRQGALRVRLRGDVPAVLAVGTDRGDARPVPGPARLTTPTPADRVAAFEADIAASPACPGGPARRLAARRPGRRLADRLHRPRQLALRGARRRGRAPGPRRDGLGRARLDADPEPARR